MDDKESIIEMAKKYFSRISNLTKSNKLYKKYIAYNSIILFVIITITLLNYFITNSLNIVATIFIIIISGLLSTLISNAYTYLLEKISDVIGHKIYPHRIGIAILIIALTISVIDLLFTTSIIPYITLVLIAL